MEASVSNRQGQGDAGYGYADGQAIGLDGQGFDGAGMDAAALAEKFGQLMASWPRRTSGTAGRRPLGGGRLRDRRPPLPTTRPRSWRRDASRAAGSGELGVLPRRPSADRIHVRAARRVELLERA
jgi:hypothetical protein